MKIFFAILTVISMAWGLFDCSKEQSFTITNAWAQTVTAPPDSTAVYFTVQNHTDGPRTLLSASTPVAGGTAFYQFVQKNGVWESDPIPSVTIPAGKDLTLRPQQTYLVLTGLKQPLKEGDSFPLTVVSDKSGATTLDVLIERPEATAYQGK